MFVVDLECSAGHRFEDWYDNRDAFGVAKDAGELFCPECGSHRVSQRLGFRGLKRHSTEPSPAPSHHAASIPLEMQRALSAIAKAVRQHAQDVGDQFAERAIAMHEGKEPQRPIHGSTTAEGEARLDAAGVAYVKLPVPEIDEN